MAQITALDWGTSSFRGYLIDENGNVAEKIRSDAGILTVKNGDFSGTLRQQLARFNLREEYSPIIASGMITSRNGWFETPYVTCPAGISELADSLQPMETEEFGLIWFVAGMNQFTPEPDIMRGEETQLVGMTTTDNLTAILPGTHSKWVVMADGRIERFTTFMTGDVYRAVLEHTILKSSPVAEWSREAYLEGVKDGYKRSRSGRTVLSGLFQVRVGGILGLRPMKQSRSYLSGMLIGAEIGEGLVSGLCSRGDTGRIVVVGDLELANLYLEGLKVCGFGAEAGPDDIVAAGLYRLARSKKLI